MELEIRLKWTHVAAMIAYVLGAVFFVVSAQYVNAIMMMIVAYWSNMAWFYEGKSRVLLELLHEAKEIMENREPVSMGINGDTHD